MILEICHANDVASGKWKVVDHNISSLKDHLASPSFEWSIGTVVRAREGDEIHYVGAYNAHECVDLSNDSRIMKRADWESAGRSNKPVPSEDFVTSLLDCVDPEALIYVLAEFFPKSKIYKMMKHCLDLIGQYLPPNLMDACDQYMLEENNPDEVWEIHERNRDLMYGGELWQQRDAAFAANSVMAFALKSNKDEAGNAILFIASVMSYRFEIDAVGAKRKLMTDIWNYTSMYEIITTAIE